MTVYLLNPDLIGMASLSAAVALAMALFAAPRMSRVAEKIGDWNVARHGSLPRQFTISLSHLVTIWAGMLCGLAVVWAWGWKVSFFWHHQSLLEQMLVGGAAVTMLGLVNDAFTLRRHQLFAGQCLTALLLISAEFVVGQVSHDGWIFWLGMFGVPATMLWLIAIMNALLSLRKSTGLAVIDGLVLTAVILVYSASQLYLSAALWCCLLLGSLAGLLVFNAPRWRTPLGPTATMLIGVQGGVLAMHAVSSGPRQIPLVAAIGLAAIPLVILLIHGVRHMIAKPTARHGRENDLLRLPERATSRLPTKAVARALETIAARAPAGPVSRRIDNPLPRRPMPAMPSQPAPASLPRVRTELSPDESGFLQISGTRDWSSLWETLCAVGRQNDLSEVELRIDMPTLNEACHARKLRQQHGEKDSLWRTEIPLHVGDRHVGKLLLAGVSRPEPYSQWMQRVASGLWPFEIHLLATLESHPHLPAQLVAPPPLELRMISTQEAAVSVPGDRHSIVGPADTDDSESSK